MKTMILFTSSNVVELYRMKAILEENGIPSQIEDEHTTQWFWHLSSAIGGAKLVVKKTNFEKANMLLFTKNPIEPKVCPQCSSQNIFFDQFYQTISILLSIIFALIPFPIYKNKWSCRDCRYNWKEK